ncbi:MAG TPA: hypothetical protein VMV69_18820 [Pirellulales bacterium]|nr:hypothetical protein [Pirellulales bacterium]
MEYDLVRLFEHPFRLHRYIPSAIVTLGKPGVDRCSIELKSRKSAGDATIDDELVLRWDLAALRRHFADIDEEIANLRERDDDQAMRVELAAVVVAVAVMAQIEPETRFTRRSAPGTRHDYYLNGSRTEMIEIAGRWKGGLPGLFAMKREQSDLNPTLTKRWVSVTIMRAPRNRTEGLHS